MQFEILQLFGTLESFLVNMEYLIQVQEESAIDQIRSDHFDEMEKEIDAAIDQIRLEKGPAFETGQEEIRSVIARIRSEKENANPEMVEEIDSVKEIYENYFPHFLRYSLIVTIVMILETQMIRLCDKIKLDRGLSMRSKDLKGDTLNQCKRYLEDVANLSLEQSLWDHIVDLSKVRNCIVHAMGDIELSNDRNHLRELVRRNQGLRIGDTVFSGLEKNILDLSPEYCRRSIQNVLTLFDNIFKAAGYKDLISSQQE
ncbi:MAG: hypothetical protein HY868_04560 [Chloroflexi bacterium]|nr:hypothetical protein [Chloroflexota bacterium]